jgi:hypothetical protein
MDLNKGQRTDKLKFPEPGLAESSEEDGSSHSGTEAKKAPVAKCDCPPGCVGFPCCK